MSDPSELDLARRFRDGDADALAALVRRHTPRLRAILARKGCPHGARDDVMQRAWLRALDARERFEPSRPFGAWVAQIAVRLWWDDLRRARTRSQAGEADPGGVTADDVAEPRHEGTADRSDREEVLRALASLPAEQREAILLTQYEGLSMREASAVTGTGVSGVKSRVSRGYAAMKGFLEDPSSRPDLPPRRSVELAVAGCERCDEVLALVQSIACTSCDVEVRQVEGDGPKLLVDGRAVEGMPGALGYGGTLRALGIGLCADDADPADNG